MAEPRENGTAEASEEMYQLLHQAPVGLVEMRADGTVELMNAMAIQLLLPHAAGRPMDNLYDALGDGAAKVRSRCDGVHGPAGAGMLCQGVRVDGPAGTLGVTVTRTSRDTLLAAVEDLTPLVAAERKAQAARKEADRANAAKSEFLAGMSHELRQPLNAILGFSDIMAAGVFGSLSERYQGYLADITASGKHLLSLINDILDIAKVEAGHIELEPEPVVLEELLSTCVRMLYERAEKRGVRLTVKDGAPGLVLIADMRRMKQVLINLLSNAIKFTPAGGTVTVRTSLRDDGGPQITVSDTGVGIAPEDLDAVMRPFEQSTAGRQQAEDSTGLGLPLAATLAELHGGRLTLDSTVGEGTTVTFDLPPSRVHAPGQETQIV
ncbi:sensor histidine kinase [Caenispirillum salinarum]|uniref:sensor histidine kinase n=1 Tax=Caenispirillum salinarum TaxID=859058 RepID=UPI00384D734B